MGHTPSTVSNPFAVNTQAKDAFAKLLATENLTVVHAPSATTASFCTQTRVLTLPVWQEMSGDLYDMLCAHEVGHALYTPADAAVVDQSHAAVDSDSSVDVGVIHDYLNVVEDIRIDRQMKDNFPGLKRCYAEAGKYLFDKDFFGVKNATPDQMASLSLLDRLNLHFKSGIYGVTAVPMTTDEAAFLPRLESMKTWDDVVALASEIYEYDGARKAAQQQPQQSQNGTPSGQSNGQGNTNTQATGTGAGSDPSDCGGDQSQQPQKGNGGEQQGDGEGSKPDSNKPQQQGSTASTGGNTGSKPQRSVTQQAEERAKKAMVDANATEVRRWIMPTLNLDQIVVGYKSVHQQFAAVAARHSAHYNGEKLLKDFRTNSADAIKMLVKQFEMKMAADESRRTRQARCGIIDMDRINDYRFSDDIFLSTEEIAKGKNHGMIFCMDWSGSMGVTLKDTIYQLLNLVLFCKSVNIPFEVYLFSDAYHANCADQNITGKAPSNKYRDQVVCKEYTKDQHGYITTGDYLKFNNFYLLNVLSSRMSKTEFDMCAGMMLNIADAQHDYRSSGTIPAGFNLGGTPLDEAVYAMVPLTEQFKKAHRLQVVNVCFLTDGESGSHPFDTWSKNGQNQAMPVLVDGNKTWTIPVRKEKSRWGGASVTMQMTTTAVMRMYLKHKTGANVVGFFLIGSAKYLDHAMYGMSTKAQEAARESMKEANFAALPGHGFDQNFLIVPTKTVKETNLSGMTGTQLKNAFARGEKSKRNSRVLMSRVADVIAKNLS
jgi:hypothetical protein